MSAYRDSAREPDAPVRASIPWARVGGAMVATGGLALAMWFAWGAVFYGVHHGDPDPPPAFRLVLLPLSALIVVGLILTFCPDGRRSQEST